MMEKPCIKCERTEDERDSCHCKEYRKWVEQQWRVVTRPLRRKPDRQYVIREAHKMSMMDLLNVLDADMQVMVEFKYDTLFHGLRNEAIQNIEEIHQKRTIKAVWYSKLNSALVIEI